MQSWQTGVLVATALGLAACGGNTEGHAEPVPSTPPAGTALVMRDTTIASTTQASAVATPFAQATVSTKLMGTVTAVLVREGAHVRAGDPLVRIDARDLDAKRQQVKASMASAEAMHHEADLMATRMRALYADSAAPRAQLDAAEAALARAQAGVDAARAGAGELDAVASYAVVRAPFGGVVTQRFVDPGAFAAPGAPLLTVQDQDRLRIVASVPPNAARQLSSGSTVAVTVEGVKATARVEGIVPSAGGALYTINAVVDNRDGALSSGGSAELTIAEGMRTALLVPAAAVRQEGDLSGVTVTSGGVTTTRWIRTGVARGTFLEVLAGLAVGDTVWVPAGAGKE